MTGPFETWGQPPRSRRLIAAEVMRCRLRILNAGIKDQRILLFVPHLNSGNSRALKGDVKVLLIEFISIV